MRFDQNHQSRDVIDRRGAGGGLGGGGGGLFRLLVLLLRSRFGWVGVIVALVAGAAWTGLQRLGLLAPGAPAAGAGSRSPEEEKLFRFVSFVFDDVQKVWLDKLPGKYRKAKLVVFTGRTPSACGMGESATGPFYCPGDDQAYIDLSFYQALSRRLGAPGDFAQAYVIAHEVGHHVQNLLGDSERVHRASKREREGDGGLLVRLELQADCYAGVWANSSRERGLLEAGDIEEALGAAAAIGDDTLQRQGSGTVRPESFTHGTSAQRARWFQIGLKSGEPKACDTFAARDL